MNVQALGRGLLIAASILIVATVIAAVVVMGTPQHQRDIRLDARRTSDLEDIVTAAREHADRSGALAGTLTQLAARPGLRLNIIDPATAQPYEYNVLDAHRFVVCATFATDTADDTFERGFPRDQDWVHPAGRQCFTKDWPKQKDAHAKQSHSQDVDIAANATTTDADQ